MRITALEPAKSTVTFALLKDEVNLEDDFDAPFPDSLQRSFQGP